MVNVRNLDKQLKQLAIAAQRYPPLTKERQLALTKLVNRIMQSGKLYHPHHGQFSAVYQDIYNEALQELLLYICQHIDRYDPERGDVMAWANYLLERRFFTAAIPEFVDKQGTRKMTLFDLDKFASPRPTRSLIELLKECIELDLENLFKQEHIEKHPEANFQTLVKQRISGKSWKDISTELNIKIPTISSFYYRCLNKFSGKLKEYCSEHRI